MPLEPPAGETGTILMSDHSNSEDNRRDHAWDVLISNASNRLAYGLLRGLASNGLKVGLGVDSGSGMGVYSRYCAGHFRHPSHAIDPLGFMQAVIEAIRLHRPAVFMPSDEDAFVVAQYAHLLRDLPVRVALAPFETLRLLDNKRQSVRLAKELGIPVPATIEPATFQEIESFVREYDDEAVLKIVRSSGGHGVFFLRKDGLEENLRRIFAKTETDFEGIIVQEKIVGRGYAVSMLFQNGEPRLSFSHRRLRALSHRGGPSTLRQSIRQPVLEAYAEKMLRHVGYHGVAMVEFLYDESTGRAWFLEVNPRWWGSLALPSRAGVDFPLSYHRLALGGEIPPQPDFKAGVTVRWLLGDIRALQNHLVHAGRFPRFRDVFPKVDGYDDAFVDDPLPLVAELGLHLKKLIFPRRRMEMPPLVGGSQTPQVSHESRLV